MISSVVPQFVLITVCVLLIVACPSWAQAPRLLTTFGPCVEQLLDYRPVALCVAHGEPRSFIAVLSAIQPYLHLYRLNDRAEIIDAGTAALSGPQQQIASVGEGEFVTLSLDGNTVTSIKRSGSSFQQHAFRIPANAQRMVVADVNNDGVKDILLFGRTMTGVATLLGRRDGSFVEGPELFPEVSVSDLATIDLNGDGIADVILLDWLSNRLMIFYGISRGIFSEQVSLSLPGEPQYIGLGPVTRQRTLRCAVTLPQDRQVALVTADATGEMEIDATVDCPGFPLGVTLGIVNEDPWLDLVVPTDKGVLALPGTAQGDFTQGAVFGISTSAALWSVADIDGDRRADAVFGEAEKQRLTVLGNARWAGHVAWPDVYAVGSGPGGVIVHDVDADGRPDICVANGGSSTVSFLLNKGEGHFDGQVSAAVPESPTVVTVTQRKAGETFITTHPVAEKLGVLTLDDGMARAEMFAIPTGSLPSVIFAREDQTAGGLVILVRNTTPSTGAQSLSLFEQLGSGQFLERSLRANLPQRIIALTVGDFSHTRGLDLAFVTNDRRTGQSTISLAHGTVDFDFSEARPLFTYPDSLATSRLLRPAEIDGDQNLDLLLVQGPPSNAIGIAYGRGDGSFRDSLYWISGVHPARDDETSIRDVDGDGIRDLVFLDDVRHAIVCVAGNADGTFSRPRSIFPSRGVTGFAVAPLRSSSACDLIISRGESATIQIVFSPFTGDGR